MIRTFDSENRIKLRVRDNRHPNEIPFVPPFPACWLDDYIRCKQRFIQNQQFNPPVLPFPQP
jgi:hypothetical protein